MTALRWRSLAPDIRRADGRRPSKYYELRRERTNTGTWWTAWFYDGLYRQRLGFGNFMQARAAAIKHYNTSAA